MANAAIRVYWDSNLFLDFISGHPEHAADAEALLEQADSGKLEIITSAISVAEVRNLSTRMRHVLREFTVRPPRAVIPHSRG